MFFVAVYQTKKISCCRQKLSLPETLKNQIGKYHVRNDLKQFENLLNIYNKSLSFDNYTSYPRNVYSLLYLYITAIPRIYPDSFYHG